MATSTTVEAASPSRLPKHARATAQAATTAPVANADAEEEAQTPLSPADTNNNSDDDDDKLFRGIRFYLSHDIVHKRRMELRTLITNNGGEALTRYDHNAVELVESNRLVRNKNWVSVDYVYDSVRDRKLRDVTQYMALDLSSVPTPAVSRNNSSSEAPAKVDGRKLGRMPYTVQEDAAMLQYLIDYPPKSMKPMKQLPLSVWKHAESLKITNRTDQSMRQHYRDTLARLTPQQRANILKNARDEADAHQRRELAAHNATQTTATTTPPKDQQPVKSSAPPASVKEQVVASTSAVGDALPTAAVASDPLPTKTTASPPSATKPASAPSSATKSSPSAAPAAAKSSRETTTAAPVETPIATATAAAKPSVTSLAAAATAKTVQDAVAGAAPSVKRQRASSLLSNRWAAMIDDTSRRAELQQFFHMPEPPAPAASASVDGETRRRKRTASSSTAAAPTRKQMNGKSRANGKETPAKGAAPTPRKQRKLRQQQSTGSSAATPAAIQAPLPPQAAAAAPTPPSPPAPEPVIEDVTSESAIQALICQIQFATNQDVNAIVHALFYASGDVRVATAFLEGESPCDVWSHHDDVLLEPLVHATTDAQAVADAYARGAFTRMRVQRSPAQILTRIRYLL